MKFQKTMYVIVRNMSFNLEVYMSDELFYAQKVAASDVYDVIYVHIQSIEYNINLLYL